MPRDDGWDVAWEPASRELRFRNRWSDEERPAQLEKHRKGQRFHVSLSIKREENDDHDRPSVSQCRDALAAALFEDYSEQVVA